MWMPPSTTLPPRSVAASAAGHDLARGREDDRRVERDRRRVDGAADPGRAQLGRQRLVARAIARADVDLGAAAARQLQRHVTGGAEAVDAQARAGPVADPGQAQRAVADDPRAQQRRGRAIAEAVGQRVDEVGARGAQLGVAAVDGPPGEVGIQCTGSRGPTGRSGSGRRCGAARRRRRAGRASGRGSRRARRSPEPNARPRRRSDGRG